MPLHALIRYQVSSCYWQGQQFDTWYWIIAFIGLNSIPSIELQLSQAAIRYQVELLLTGATMPVQALIRCQVSSSIPSIEVLSTQGATRYLISSWCPNSIPSIESHNRWTTIRYQVSNKNTNSIPSIEWRMNLFWFTHHSILGIELMPMHAQNSIPSIESHPKGLARASLLAYNS